jgi:hypothetical protein
MGPISWHIVPGEGATMTRKFYILALGTLGLAAGASAQYVKVDINAPGYGTDVFYGASYDQSTTFTFKAKVRGISTTPSANKNQAADVALLVSPFKMGTTKNGKKTMVFQKDYKNVELGPDWFVKAQSLQLKRNDYIEITGSKMKFGDMELVIAKTVRRGHEVLALHRLSGEPYWYAFRYEAAQQALRQKNRNDIATTPAP